MNILGNRVGKIISKRLGNGLIKGLRKRKPFIKILRKPLRKTLNKIVSKRLLKLIGKPISKLKRKFK